MKKDTGNKMRLGLFITGGILLFIVGIFYIGERQHLFGGTMKVKFVCNNVSGLQPGNNVRFAGIDVGTVEGITITSDTSVQVDLMLEHKVQKFIRKDAQASVGSDGLMGDKVVNISSGSSSAKPVENNDQIVCAGGNDFDQIVGQMKIVATNAAQITDDMSAITNNIRSGKGSVGKLFMDTVFAENLSKTIVNLKTGAGGFSDNMKAAQNSFLLKGYFKKKEKKKEEAKEAKDAEKNGGVVAPTGKKQR